MHRRYLADIPMPLDFIDFAGGARRPLFLIAGPCVLESETLAMQVAETLSEICGELGIPYIFKSSFDKANRTSARSYRGPGIADGLELLAKIQSELGIPVLTDVHEDTPIDEVADVVDVLQTPAFLVRQTNFMQRVGAAGKPVNIKKGQFQAPWDMGPVVDKMKAAGNERVMLCERGASFGYNPLISDMRGLAVMRRLGRPVVFDATHSVQQPGGMGTASGGQREFVPVLARAAVAAGVDGVFMETHPDPDNALSDGPNMWPLPRVRALLEQLLALDRVTKQSAFLEDSGDTPAETSAK